MPEPGCRQCVGRGFDFHPVWAVTGLVAVEEEISDLGREPLSAEPAPSGTTKQAICLRLFPQGPRGPLLSAIFLSLIFEVAT